MKRVLISLIVIWVSGCTHLYKMYEYEGAEIETKFGEIGVNVSGSWSEVSKEPEITELTEPYTIRIGFITPDRPGQEIVISVLEVGPSSVPVKYYKAGEIGKTKASFVYQGESTTSWYAAVVSGIKPNYEPIRIKFKLTYRGESEIHEVTLKPNYWEEKRSNFIDGIMSV